MVDIIWHGKKITIDELCVVESLKTITDTMYEEDPYCYKVSLEAMSEAGFTEFELITEYLEWSSKPLEFK